jgi:cell wall-associated NlpC family hydrolase
MVYKLSGVFLKRDFSQQAQQGELINFINESQLGDLAFFENEEGNIIHVGIIIDNEHIIHAFGKVRIDKIDHNGIFNEQEMRYSHKLRLLKRIFTEL